MNDLITITKEYWFVVVTLVTFVTALLTALVKWQTIRANRLKQRRATQGLRFEKIRVDAKNRYWTEWRPSSRSALVTPAANSPDTFSANCKQYFHILEVVSGADPSFDIILFNPGNHETSILAVGVRVQRVIHYSYTLPGVAGDMPRAERLDTSEKYCLRMPDIFSRVRHHDFDESDTPAEIGEVVKQECDPYVLQPGARFRFTLVLKDYMANMPFDTILSMWIETSDGDKESHELYVRYAPGFSEKTLRWGGNWCRSILRSLTTHCI